MKVYIDKNECYFEAVKYTFNIFSQNKGLPVTFVETESECTIKLNQGSNPNSLFIDQNFYTTIFKEKRAFKFIDIDSRDKISQAFYLINSLHECYFPKFDSIGRYLYSESLQYLNNSITNNSVQKLFDEIFESISKITSCKEKINPSRVFISHDIDNINSGWKEDGFAALKKGKPLELIKIIAAFITNKPHWMNIDKIINIHSEYDLKSTFFWIVNKGLADVTLSNADYNFSSQKIQNQLQLVNENGFENGLHKSVSNESYTSEIKKLGFTPLANRNHYLKFNLPQHYKNIHESGIKVDCSLGFAEHFGFRNNYGLPFQPFDIENNKAFDFVEVPLHLMDRTFSNYMKIPVNQVAEKCIKFIENNNTNCIISILWHNNFFSSIKYDGYLEAYKKILVYLYESKISSISTKEIYETYKIS